MCAVFAFPPSGLEKRKKRTADEDVKTLAGLFPVHVSFESGARDLLNLDSLPSLVSLWGPFSYFYLVSILAPPQ